MSDCDKIDIVYDNDGPIVDKRENRPIRLARIETQYNGYFTLVIENLKESEAFEIVDIIKARKHLD